MRRTTLKARLFIIGAALAGCSALGIAGATAASAGVQQAGHAAVADATTACSGNCTDIWFVNPGSEALVTSHSALNKANNVVRLTQGSNGAAKQDLSEISVGDVDPEYCTHGGQSQPGSIFTPNQCHLLAAANLLSATTFQYAFNPDNGGPENECLGAWNNDAPVSGWKIRLEPCGESPDTVIIETDTLDGATLTSSQQWLIDGASDNYSNPLVATSAGSFPSNLTWTQIDVNGKQGIDTQEACLTSGPFTSGASC
jgi:hypothetical protein